MEGTMLTDGPEKPPKQVRFRVASGNSGRVLKEMFKDEGPSGSLDSDCTSSSDADRASTPSTSGDVQGHVYLGSELDDSGCQPDDLLVYAGATKDWTFTTKRVNILSKNGTVRGVRHKVTAGQTLFENFPSSTSVSIPDVAALLVLDSGQDEWRMLILLVFLKSRYSLELHVSACWDRSSPQKTRSACN